MLHDLVSYILIGLSLSMDAFAVSVSSGICVPNLKIWHEIRSSAAFGIAQFVMPVAGWFLGAAFIAWIAPFDHWIAFALLGFVGGRMFLGAIRGGGDEDKPRVDPTAGWELVVLSVATSIDALAVGLSLAALGSGILIPAAVIGLVAAAFTLAGMLLGRRIGALWGRRVEAAGGIILVAIGARILVRHLME